MASRKPTARRGNSDIDVDDELQQLLKEQEAFMRQSQRPAAKITRMGPPPAVASVVEKNIEEAKQEQEMDDGEAMEDGVQVVGHVQERDIIQLTETNRILQPRTTAGGFPAVSRRGVSLFGRRQRQQPTSDVSKLSGKGKIVERAPVVASATRSSSPLTEEEEEENEKEETPKRSDVVSDKEWAEIDQSNASALRNMSVADIREAQQELFRMLDPELIAKLKNRSKKTKPIASKPDPSAVASQADATKDAASKRMDVVNVTKALVAAGIDLSTIETEEELFAQAQRLPAEERAKHEWMQPVPSPPSLPEETSTRASKPAPNKRHPVRQNQSKKPATPASGERFDFSGDRVVHSASVPTHTGLHHHGDDPEAAGYTIDELLHLARSTNASQRAVALVTISKILTKRQQSQRDQRECVPRVLPKELPVALRMALDDQNFTALSAAIRALYSFLSPEVKQSGEGFESACGTVVSPPQIHVHVDVDASQDELLRDVVYIDTSASTSDEDSGEDGGEGGGGGGARSGISDQELLALDPIQGLLKMEIIPRISYILTTIQLPDADAIYKLLAIVIHIASHSPRSAQAIVADAKLIKAIQSQYLENETVLTLQTEPAEEFTSAVALTRTALVLVRVLCQGSRAVATTLVERGMVQSTKGFLALRLETTPNPLDTVQCESLRIWRVLLGYGMDFHCFAYLHPLLCGFGGVQLVQDTTGASARTTPWSDASLAALLAALEAFAQLASIHDAQHYFHQFGVFLTLAHNELSRRLSSGTSGVSGGDVVATGVRFLIACCPLVHKFRLDKTPFRGVFLLLQTLLSTGEIANDGLLVLVMKLASQMLQHDLVGDDQDDEEVRERLLQQLKPLVSSAISQTETKSERSPVQTCELLLLATDLCVRTDHHDDAFLRALYTTALQTVPLLTPGHQFYLHCLFTGVLFQPVVLQKTGFFPDLADATTMSRVLIPIYQALVNSTKDQEDHSLRLFGAGLGSLSTSPTLKRTCHLVEPQDEQLFIGSNLPLPFFWMFCPFSRLEYTPSRDQDEKTKHAATTLGPSHAQADEMKVIVSAACRYLDQLETIVGSAVQRSSSSSTSGSTVVLGDEDKLFHLMHVFFAGADVLFDDHVDLALSKLLTKYASRLLLSSSTSPTALYDGMLRNLRQFESIEAGEVRDTPETQQQQKELSAASSSFTSASETVMTFVEKLVNEFTSSSFGNTQFARLVTLFVLHDFPSSLRKWVWKELSDSHLLHRLEPFESGRGSDTRLATGQRATRDAIKSDETLVRVMVQSITGSQSTVSPTRGPFAYWIAVHHIVAYTFGTEHDEKATDKSFSFSRQKLLQDLVQRASPGVWRHVLSYETSTFAPMQHSGDVKQHRVDRVLQCGGLSDTQRDVVLKMVASFN